jgi:crotonobetainyl-CoA:carnitine CoA-transferase CaiB-like acyl-CoA transferase
MSQSFMRIRTGRDKMRSDHKTGALNGLLVIDSIWAYAGPFASGQVVPVGA